jgi:hypothetical protein
MGSVMIETTLGEFVVDLYADKCPLAAKNFLKLCKTKYYNDVLVYNVQQNFMIQAGDPTGAFVWRGEEAGSCVCLCVCVWVMGAQRCRKGTDCDAVRIGITPFVTTGTGSGGTSIYGMLYGEQVRRCFCWIRLLLVCVTEWMTSGINFRKGWMERASD